MYDKIKKVTIWMPVLGVLLMLICEKNWHTSMYDDYFDWGSPLLVIISAVWQYVSIGYIIVKFLY